MSCHACGIRCPCTSRSESCLGKCECGDRFLASVAPDAFLAFAAPMRVRVQMRVTVWLHAADALGGASVPCTRGRRGPRRGKVPLLSAPFATSLQQFLMVQLGPWTLMSACAHPGRWGRGAVVAADAAEGGPVRISAHYRGFTGSGLGWLVGLASSQAKLSCSIEGVNGCEGQSVNIRCGGCRDARLCACLCMSIRVCACWPGICCGTHIHACRRTSLHCTSVHTCL